MIRFANQPAKNLTSWPKSVLISGILSAVAAHVPNDDNRRSIGGFKWRYH